MNLIFDFDGTICDSFDKIVKIFQANYPEITKDITPEYAREVGVKQLLKDTRFPKYKIPKLLSEIRKYFTESIPELKTFPKMETTIMKLSLRHSLGILTSNSQKNVKKFLNNNGLTSYFLFIDSESSMFGKHKRIKNVIKKYNLDPKITIYIGDETRDAEAAKKVGIKSTLVTWGFESKKILEKTNPDYIVETPLELLTLFK